MKRYQKFWLFFTFLFFVLIVAEEPISEGKMISEIRFSDNRLTVNIDKMTLASVLEGISQKTGIEFIIDKKESEKIISIKLNSLPIGKALSRIISNFDHAIFFGPNGKAYKVLIYGRKKLSQTSNMHLDKGNNIISFNAGVNISPNNEKMEINESPDKSIPDGMTINESLDRSIPDGMTINKYPDNVIPAGIKINQSPVNAIPHGIEITSSSDEMTPVGIKINRSPDNTIPDGMIINPSSGEGMKINHPRDSMKIPQPAY